MRSKHDGCFLDPKQVMVHATNELFNVNYYLDYLCDKYTKLYDLKGEN